MLLACSTAQDLTTAVLAPTALFLSQILPLLMVTHDYLGSQDREGGRLEMISADEQMYGPRG
jgi:hypothetical protein